MNNTIKVRVTTLALVYLLFVLVCYVCAREYAKQVRNLQTANLTIDFMKRENRLAYQHLREQAKRANRAETRLRASR